MQENNLQVTRYQLLQKHNKHSSSQKAVKNPDEKLYLNITFSSKRNTENFIPWIFFSPFWKNLQQVTSNELLQVTNTKSLS
jgi:hypothetical protein